MQTRKAIFKTKSYTGNTVYEVITKEVATGFSVKHLGFFRTLRGAKAA